MTELALTGVGRVLPGERGMDWFEVATVLPGRGYKRLPPAIQYLLAAANEAVADLGGLPEARLGAAIGTNNSCTGLLHQMNQTIIESDAERISPLTAPYFVISLPAGRLAIELGIHGFSVTLTSPRTAGLDALRVGGRALAAGRAEVMFVGAAEDALPPAEPGHEGSDAGAIVLICEDAAKAAARGADVRGVVRVQSAFVLPGHPADEALDGAWAALEPPSGTNVHAVLDDSPVGKAVGEWLADRAPGCRFTEAPAGCLTPLEWVAGLLDGAGVVVTAAAEGNVALARVTPWSERNGS